MILRLLCRCVFFEGFVQYLVYIDSKNFCCFTQTTTPTQQPPRLVAGKGDEQLVEQLIQQIEQLRNEGSAKDREIAEMRKQNADLQTAMRGERQQTVNTHQQIVEVRQRIVDLQRALRDEQVQREHAVDRERRDKQRLEREKDNLQQQLNREQREKANILELLSESDAAIERYKQENEVFNIPSRDIQLTGTELGRGAYGGEILYAI